MTVEEIRSACMASIASTWATCTVIAWPNHPFIAPTNAAWIRPNIKMGPSFIGELGDDGISLRTGSIMIEIFIPVGIGTKAGTSYAARLEALLRRKDIGGIMCREPETTDVGIDGSGFYKMITSCSFETWVGE